jgi:hypothetical protein
LGAVPRTRTRSFVLSGTEPLVRIARPKPVVRLFVVRFQLLVFVVMGLNYALIRQVANETRRWAEKENKERNKPFSTDLCGMCAIAAAELFTRLTKAGVSARISANHEHCFVEVLDAAGRGGLIVDVTATQFGRDKILITRRSELGIGMRNDSFYWKAREKFYSVEDLREWQAEVGWPENQIILT